MVVVQTKDHFVEWCHSIGCHVLWLFMVGILYSVYNQFVGSSCSFSPVPTSCMVYPIHVYVEYSSQECIVYVNH